MYQLKLVSLFALLLSSTLFAADPTQLDCSSKLLNNFTADSVAHSLNVDSIDYRYRCTAKSGCLNPLSDRLFAVSAVKELLTSLGCGSAEIEKVTFKKSECHRFAKSTHKHLVCYVPTSYGFFYLTRDYVDGAQIIFNRWD